jgi:hypothetical protein
MTAVNLGQSQDGKKMEWGMADEPEEIDLDQIVWDPRYRRRIIERLNAAPHEHVGPAADTASINAVPGKPEPTPRR